MISHKWSLSILLAIGISLFSGVAVADDPTHGASVGPGVSDPRIDEILSVNPSVSSKELAESIADHAINRGISEEDVVAMLYEDSSEARAAHIPKATELSTNSTGEGTAVKLGCAAAGYFTYSYSKTLTVAHGHNTLFTGQCEAVHMPGRDIPSIRRITSTYTGLRTHASYPAHLRRVDGASINMNDRAGQFGINRLSANVQYESDFSFNKHPLWPFASLDDQVWKSTYNCSSLVWAAWMYASTYNVDLDRNGGPGVYPEDLWKSPLTVLSRYLERA
ncbi:hypothetical protein H5392_07080 [Tessaracoccus sp. MC1865]|uniref:hypothetical protein n=1 Tax=Tessaracoccus sp. MC1865 TaxID=2760310 RepID=UPI0015FF4F77|nr:hypothetical protein [Tessaracoccus sp. MC1865]MBB1483623.1 hypothetical protein [Tessaracoccus sp. MC1865]QTO36702.1 hypothetical protein J7D54_09455 [Tessaracoccus sp. MC1865]